MKLSRSASRFENATSVWSLIMALAGLANRRPETFDLTPGELQAALWLEAACSK